MIDVALAMATGAVGGSGLQLERSLRSSQRSLDDPYLWAAMAFLSSRLPRQTRTRWRGPSLCGTRVASEP